MKKFHSWYNQTSTSNLFVEHSTFISINHVTSSNACSIHFWGYSVTNGVHFSLAIFRTYETLGSKASNVHSSHISLMNSHDNHDCTLACLVRCAGIKLIKFFRMLLINRIWIESYQIRYFNFGFQILTNEWQMVGNASVWQMVMFLYGALQWVLIVKKLRIRNSISFGVWQISLRLWKINRPSIRVLTNFVKIPRRVQRRPSEDFRTGPLATWE